MKIFGIFDKRSLIWFHYVLLVGALFGLGYLIDTFIPSLNILQESFMWRFIIVFLMVSISDQLIHKVIGVD